MSLFNIGDYFRLVSHVFGHGNWEHLFNNVTYLLLLGPILEEKYGSYAIVAMMFITALSTGVINVLLFSTGLMGASGIVFMLIILISIVDIKEGTIPVTFLVVATIFIGRELIHALYDDSISQAAHIVGGSLGAFFGFFGKKGLKSITQ
ncbi:MAG TPA: rhomboid family intramembrane serine protease [Thermodesulfovibrionia bacterium]|nr:rhomboid family intramembrane serine protease [Thermodesulfovibrionia bacterium]